MSKLALSFVAAALTFAAACSAQEAAPPNIVLIFIDDLGYGDVGPFGHAKVETPHLDRMAAEGTKFDCFYATPVCSMSRACLMTGCYNVRVSVPGVLFPRDSIGLHPDEMTIADVLKQKGYATTCIGKWHLGHREAFLPTKQGFDSYFGIPYSNDMTIDAKHARFADDCVFREGFTRESSVEKEIRHTVPLMRNEEIVEYPADQATLTKRYTEEAIRFIKDNKTRPFFVYLPHTMVHLPLAASEDFLGKSGEGLIGDAILEIDWSVGQILDALQAEGLDERTLVIFTSDNGAAVGSSAPWRGKKATVYEGGVREPCIMRWPGRIPEGETCPSIAGNIDLLPTFAKLVGAELPADRELDGRDISSLMFDPAASPVRTSHVHFTNAGQLGAYREGDWKIVFPRPRNARQNQIADDQELPALELYDLSQDPYETTNVAAEHPEIAGRLRAEAQRQAKEIRERRRPAGQAAD